MRFVLLAVREDVDEKARVITRLGTYSQAKRLIEKMEDDETWPEGYDAVLHDVVRDEWLTFTGVWETTTPVKYEMEGAT